METFRRWSLKCTGKRAGLILTSPEGIDVEYALRFGFHASNNEAEYEAVIAGLNLAHSLEVDQLEVHSDSQLVVRQIEDTYEAKSEKMVLYLQKVPRTENSRADALAKTGPRPCRKILANQHLSNTWRNPPSTLTAWWSPQ